jgi:hypothetical protein
MIHSAESLAFGMKQGATLSAILVAAVMLGCSEPSPCIVTGSVLVNNRPAGGVYVALHSAEGETVGAGRSSEDGTFRLTVKTEGEYPITCFFPSVTKSGEDTVEGDDQFKGRYRNPQLPVANAAVKTGDNVLPPIQLMR